MAASDILVSNAALISALGGLSYVAGLMIYRIYFSPIAKFPGPKIAAVTYWYEFYYDALLGGQYVWQIQEMHRRYGPVVRINPHELHIANPDYYTTLYASGKEQRDKVPKYVRQFGAPDTVLGAVPHDLHRMRRAAISPFFSKSSVYRLEPLIREKVDEMIERIQAFGTTKKPITMFPMFTAFSNDVVMEYAFARCDHRLRMPDFDLAFCKAFASASQMCHWTLHMNWMLKSLQAVPVWIAIRMMPGLGGLMDFQEKIKQQIGDIKSGKNKNHEKVSHRTIFHDILDSNMPAPEKAQDRLWQEGQVIVGAGTETTAWTLTVAMVNILSNPQIRQRLGNETRGMQAQKAAPLNLSNLEQLPYLTCCIKESLRLSYGVTSRLPRVASTQSLHVAGSDLEIPPGTIVSMNSVLIHRDPNIFPNPDTFIPERWIENPGLERYLVSFSKGARMCLGINLAYAELYLALGSIFGHFGGEGDGGNGRLELLGVTPEDLVIAGDMFVPSVRGGNKHFTMVCI